MTETPSTLGRRIATLRDRRGWTQKQLAERASVSVPFLSEIENDKRKAGADVILRIAKALRASLNYLMKGEQQETEGVRQPLLIPPELAETAEEEGWSYAITAENVETVNAVIARRGGTSSRPHAAKSWTKEEWIDFHRRLFRGESGD
ncbi:MAG: helix-turn-helix transcriptional regulator [Thermodesulfobacteriota bacterium]